MRSNYLIRLISMTGVCADFAAHESMLQPFMGPVYRQKWQLINYLMPSIRKLRPIGANWNQ